MRSYPALPAAILACVVATLTATAQGSDVPYVPTPEPVVDRMLRMAQAGPADVVYDLGSGDGRIVIAAVRDFGVRKGVGIDIDPERIAEANEAAQRNAVSDRVQFMEADIFKTDFSEATIVTMYLLGDVNLKLRPRLLNELRPGTRLVSHQFDMGDWMADDEEVLAGRQIYYWVVPARASGHWTGSAGAESLSLEIDQSYQRIGGELRIPGGSGTIRNGRLHGDRVSFDTELHRHGTSIAARFEGLISGDGNLEGVLATAQGNTPVRASRTHRAELPARQSQ